MSLKIHIANDLPGRHIIYYVVQLMAFNKGVVFNYVGQSADADLIISAGADSDFPLDIGFYQNLTWAVLSKTPFEPYPVKWADDQTDRISRIFYLVNCLQEYYTVDFDQYGRYPYKKSVQHEMSVLHYNGVQILIDELWSRHPKLSQLKTTKHKSSFFLTHDIDTVYGAKNQNGAYALKNHQYHKIPKLLWNHYIGKPDWVNMDKIMDIEEQFGFRSTFYWLVYKDKMNSDYDLRHTQILKQTNLIETKGFENGLHKSLRDTSFDNELSEMCHVMGKKRTIGQRYHFLKFNLPQAWQDIEDAGLKLDTSLGFSEDFGFRNSYGLPFMPYNIKENRVYDLIEVPMNVMDGNFFYHGKTLAQAEKELIDWLDQNKENSVITLNFHNNFFDDMLYAGYDKLYTTLLRYFKEEGMACMTQKSLLEKYYNPDFYKIKDPTPQ